ncbi:hypothetical protein [Achromobacter anxifer]|uniref:hypothetical protein n=1 Tax=Achromobacter anxifer TaxID=1287737 RepID=UPI0023F83500|nr:hypothetical protein [Achromobacter anxifer]MDF8359448.1 hypothetical protein [Achromobacter anxifer]
MSFVELESLGANFNPKYKRILYGYARDAFVEAWHRGLNYGWRDQHYQENARANERMRAALASMGPNQVTAASHPVRPEQPRDTTIDMGWYGQRFPLIYGTHMDLFQQVHARQKTPRSAYPELVNRLYFAVLSISWRAGWQAGEKEAETQFAQRQHTLASTSLLTVDHEATELEQGHVYDCTLALFDLPRPGQEQAESAPAESYDHPRRRDRIHAG